MVIQGREITNEDIELVNKLSQANPLWNRTRFSQELCLVWNWRAANSQIKDMSCRTFLRRLEERGYITLSPSQAFSGRTRRKAPIPYIPHKIVPIACHLKNLAPVEIKVVHDGELLGLFKCLIHCYHYLGFSGTVGENMKYMVFDRENNPLACLLFGAAAWKSAPRDNFIGWDDRARKANLKLLTNNMRFLILPWVRVPHLASHILGRVAQRISSDFVEKYGHPIYLLETFVERQRFGGICYQAANWICVGQTKGRSRNDRYHSLKAAIKNIYLYPVSKGFRDVLKS